MKLEDLLALGATVACGSVDFKNRQVGVLQKDGTVTVTDETALSMLQAVDVVAAETPAPRRGRPPKVAESE